MTYEGFVNYHVENPGRILQDRDGVEIRSAQKIKHFYVEVGTILVEDN